MKEMLQKAQPYYDASSNTESFTRDVVHPITHRNLLNDDDTYSGYGFPITDYSLKYARCQMIRSFSDEAVENGYYDVMTGQSFVVFRLCPTSSCSKNRRYGCSSAYGQYVLPLDDYMYYLGVFNEAKEKHYCYWCKNCLNGNGNRKKKKRRRRKLEGEEDVDEAEYAEEEYADEADEAEDAYVEEYDEAEDEAEYEEEEEEQVSCPSECDYYSTRCQNNNNDDVIDYENYLGCKRYRAYNENAQKVNLYVGAYCASDSTTIKIDVFYDQFCTNYAGDEYDVNEVTGVSFDSSGLSDYFSDECITCRESDLPYQNGEADEEDDDAVSEICEQLYDLSGKCNTMLASGGDDETMSSVQYANQETSCTYIDNILTGSYNQEGNVYINQKEYNKQKGYYEQVSGSVAGWQVASLVFLVFGVVVLAGMAFHLEPLVKVPVPGDKQLLHHQQGGGMVYA
uniref:Uncharacterized protein n=1 Tax=Leptocylindrus danicus TaxID=163516 RepID=A0A7S2KEZ4_9STRA